MAKDPNDNEELNDEPLDDENEGSQDEEERVDDSFNPSTDDDDEEEDEEDDDDASPELSDTVIAEGGDMQSGLFDKEERIRRKADLLEKYKSKMSDMDDIAQMTSTTTWHDMQSYIRAQELKETANLKVAEKSRDIHQAQVAVRIYPSIIELVSKRVTDFEEFINNAPKYAQCEMPRRVRWDEENSTIIFSEIVDLQEELELD